MRVGFGVNLRLTTFVEGWRGVAKLGRVAHEAQVLGVFRKYGCDGAGDNFAMLTS